MQNAVPIHKYELGTIKVSARGKDDTWSKDYVDILSNNKPIKFILDSRLLNTERGIYSEFVKPSNSMKVPLYTLSELAVRHEATLNKGSNLYLDVVLNTDDEEDQRLYNALLDLQDILANKIIECIREGYGPLQEYLSKHIKRKDKWVDEFKFMFLKDNLERDNIKYVHLKIIKSTKSYSRNKEIIERNMLCYKAYRTISLVRVDNIRIPKTRTMGPSLNVHLCVEAQIVEECIAEESHFDILQMYL